MRQKPSVENPAPHDFSDQIYELASSPLQALHSSFLEDAGIRLLVKRDDLIHPEFGGNKWRKMKYNLAHARNQQFDTLLTFGGAWSNHIYATAAAGNHFGFKTIGIIRGEKHTPLNPTLQSAERNGMQLHYVTRAEYRQKHLPDTLEKIQQRFGKVYILPEGGSNALAIKGCKEIVNEVNESLNMSQGKSFDVICCACGTGATLAGLISALQIEPACTKQRAIGFSALKGGSFLNREAEQFLSEKQKIKNWYIEDRYHFGGYAKVNTELIQFINDFKDQYGIMLDAVYTGKMFYGLFQLIKSGEFEPGTTIVAVHSGGLQGNKGFGL